MTRLNPNSASPEETAIRDTAARWVVRQDRRLSRAETGELEAWLAADGRHAEAFERSVESWRTFRSLGSAVRRAPVEGSTARTRRAWTLAGGLAAAAALVLLGVSWQRTRLRPAETVVAHAAPESSTRRLADGSVARLKGEAQIAETFSATERRVRLVRGEVYFAVAKDAARPFLVEVGDATVRAVGTAFAIRFEPHAIDVLVTEGVVQVTPPAARPAAADRVAAPAAPAMVGAGHRAVMARAAAAQTPAVVVTAVSPAEIARTLAWNEPMLELAGATLGELVAAFAQRSGRRIEIADPALRDVRIGGLFPTGDVDGFLHALAEIYEVKAERRADGSIVLTKR